MSLILNLGGLIMKIKSLLIMFMAGCFMLFSLLTQAQKSNILIEKGLAYLASTQNTSKGFDPGQGTSIDPENIYQMTKTAGDWGGAGITSLCLQAFLQNGHNIDDPLYGTQVTNAINYLLGMQTLSGYEIGRIGTWSHGYETAMAIEALNLALETPLFAGGYISGTLATDIQDAIDLAVAYYVQDINVAWEAVSWRYSRSYTSTYSGDMSVNQWVYLALDAVGYTDKDIWTKIYTYMNNKKYVVGNTARIGYQSYGTRTQGMTCAGTWGAVLSGSHGVGAAAALKTQFLNYLETFSLGQLMDLGSIGNNQIYSGGGYYYYLYGFAKAMALSNRTIFSGGDWYVYLYNTIEGLHKTNGSGNYYWDDWGGQGANMETALALLCLQTQSVPLGSTLKISFDNTYGGTKDECFEFKVFDEQGNAAGRDNGIWYTNIPLSEWTSTTPDLYELTVEVQESTNYSVQIKNICLEPATGELCYRTYLEEQLTDEECFPIENAPPFTPIGATGFVNAIGGLNVIIVVPPTPLPEMEFNPEILSVNPFEYNQTFDLTFDIMEVGGETPLINLDLFPSDLEDQFGNIIPAANITVDPIFIDIIAAGESQTVNVSITTPATLTFEPGLFEGVVTVQAADQVMAVNIELGSPDMFINPDVVLVPPTNGSSSFDIDFTGMVGADWELSFDADWFTADPMSGSGDGMVTVNYLANGSDMERTAEITISAAGALNPEEVFTITQEAAPYPFFIVADLEGSYDQMVWWNVDGSLESGYSISMDVNQPYYYLTLGDQTQTNMPLAEDMFPFYLDPATVPDGFYEYWANRGVVEGAAGWQAVMWEIINGNEPTFYIKVSNTKDQAFMLVDGLQYLFGGVEDYLRVNGDYMPGSYGYTGFIESENAVLSDEINIMITFYQPELLQADLIVSEDEVAWNPALGNLFDGYLVRLDEMVEHYYLNLGEETMANTIMMNDIFPFYLDPETVPDGFYEYWALRGVLEGAEGWQGIMWEIINGNQPTFYIKVEGEGDQTFTLVDGLQFLAGNGEFSLMVPGDYPLGTYVYSGVLLDQYEVPTAEIPVMITFASDVDQQIELMAGWLGISSYIVPEEPALENVLAGIEDDMAIMISMGGLYWPSQGINTMGDWNTYVGYKIKILQPTMLEIFGFQAETTVDLPAGLSYMPVLSPDELSTDIFTEMGDDLLYAFNFQDQTVFWPEGGLNTIGTIEPGVGYLVNLVNPVSVDFSLKTAVNTQPVTPFINNSPWNDAVNTGNPHIISIDVNALDVLESGDYIGVFDNNGNIAGITEYTGGNNNLQLIANGDDFTTSLKDGLADGEMMTFMVYKNKEDQVYQLEATFSDKFSNGVFEPAGLTMITDLKLGALGFGDHSASRFNAYPNPTSGQLNITANSAYTLEIINAAGQILFKTAIDGDAILDLSKLENGVYFMKASSEKGLFIEKLIIK